MLPVAPTDADHHCFDVLLEHAWRSVIDGTVGQSLGIDYKLLHIVVGVFGAVFCIQPN
jgi:hypothetical protein